MDTQIFPIKCMMLNGNWNGMEWNVEWNGMEWNGMEWNGIENEFYFSKQIYKYNV